MEAARPAVPAERKSRRCIQKSLVQSPRSKVDLGQQANPQILELNRRAFGFQAQVSARRLGIIAPGDFFAVDPEADFAVDTANVIVVPLAGAFGQFFARKAAAAVGRAWLKRFEGRL